VDYKLDVRISARIIDLEVSYAGTQTFRFWGLGVEYDNDGNR